MVRRAPLLSLRSTTEDCLILLEGLRHVDHGRRFQVAAPRTRWLHQMVGRLTQRVSPTGMAGMHRHLLLLYGVILVLLTNDCRAHDVHLLL